MTAAGVEPLLHEKVPIAAAAVVGSLSESEAEAEAESKAVAPSPGPAPSSLLHRHALESVFGFLSLSELHVVLSVSAGWLAAVGSMAPIGAAVLDRYFDQFTVLGAMCSSRLARHVARAGSRDHPLLLDDAALRVVAATMTNLQTLYCQLKFPPPPSAYPSRSPSPRSPSPYLAHSPSPCPSPSPSPSPNRGPFGTPVRIAGPAAAAAAAASASAGGSVAAGSVVGTIAGGGNEACWKFPSKLTSLYLSLDHASTTEVNAAIEAVAELVWLRRLRLWMIDIGSSSGSGSVSAAPAGSAVSFAALQRMLHLERFGVHWLDEQDDDVPLSEVQVDELRGMRRLAVVAVEPTADLMRRLLRQPHQLKWQRFGPIRRLLTSDECALLPALLPSLTRLDCVLESSTTDVSFLSPSVGVGLPHLRELELRCHGVSEAVTIGRLLPVLMECVGLAKLILDYCAFSSAHLEALIPRLSELTHLTLIWAEKLDSLRFLSRGRITHTLTSLSLRHGRQMPLRELEHVHALKELRYLDIKRAFLEPLDDYTQHLYARPDSLLLPKLTHFSYQKH